MTRAPSPMQLAGALFAAAVLASTPVAAEPAKLGTPVKPPAPKAPKATTVAATGLVERARVEVAPSGKPFKQLTIENALGDVRIEGYDGTAMVIETHKLAPDADTLDRLRVSLVPNPDGTVRITTAVDAGPENRPVPRAAARIDLVIRAPRDARIDAVVGAGKLEVNNMDAGGELDTAAGPITVRNLAGALEAHTVSGAMTLAQVFGSVDAQTLSANVELDTIGGDRLVASAHHGSIAGRRVRARNVELTTTEGNIHIDADTGLDGHLVVSSLRGDIAVQLHHHGAITVRARGGGKVDLGGPTTILDGWTQAAFTGTGDPAVIELRSRYGAVQFAIVE